ncbi:glutaredoxin family protein [Cellulomonas carbonis]|uniref:Uncharacterized protein n=1 Tax=Cellulomonas carbonis T26 TaxID=947969 RepID=A0A0A0BTS0_9CELL|nr:glutaredoxin family protein [Cellulomonas carbonis]KGM11783.1 hypothetical protein N868_06665 [Cellulomonas carbonis T26]GGC09118.1 thioredoxin family protein [Cellulomonas carbonis]
MTTQPDDDASRVVLHVRSGCHLCDDARAALAAAGVRWTEVDVDTGPASADLVARYGDLVPVVSVDGVQQGFWRIDADRVVRALAAGPR